MFWCLKIAYILKSRPILKSLTFLSEKRLLDISSISYMQILSSLCFLELTLIPLVAA